MERRSDPSPKCSECGVSVLDSDLVLRDHGQLYHVQCARVPTSDQRVREYRELRRACEGTRDEPPAVLCVLCQTGIGSVAELVMTGSGPAHVHCRPA